MTSLEKMKAEAIQRMRILRFHPMAIKDFEKYGQIGYSFHTFGFCFLREQEKDRIRQFEKEHGCLVYYVIDSYASYPKVGRTLSYLYVSSNEEEWAQDRQDLEEGRPMAYVKNVDNRSLSGFNNIEIELRNGGVIRTAEHV